MVTFQHLRLIWEADSEMELCNWSSTGEDLQQMTHEGVRDAGLEEGEPGL